MKHSYARVWIRAARHGLVGVAFLCLVAPALAEDKCKPADPMAANHIYPSNGVHNDCYCAPPAQCDFKDEPGRPPEPLYPEWWISEWTMYQVFNNYRKVPPPYTNPPEGLEPTDYRTSRGSTFFDNSYVPADGDGTGAMMEFYGYNQCLPIFPKSNNYTCAFVSLGNKAYFLDYGTVHVGPQDNGALPPPDVTPKCCQFSLYNHPPRPDFIRHLPYSPKDSEHLDSQLNAYAYSPNPHAPDPILFAYAFYKDRRVVDPKTGKEYPLPQSFYFSGSTTNPPDAPIVSQNYERFRVVQPRSELWGIVEHACPATPKWCCLFDSDCPDGDAAETEAEVNTNWSNIRPGG